MTILDTIAALEGVIGKTPPPMHLKVIDHLDAGALRWIAQSPLMFAGFGAGGGIGVTLAGGAPGFANGVAHELRLPVGFLDDPALARPNAAFGSLFLLPGIGETLRVNGRVAAIETDHVRVNVEECYGHCAKALIRSELWAAEPAQAPGDPAAFVAACRFLALATLDAEGRADLSPKGDPAGCMAQLDDDVLWFADRPGNRRVDSFRNIVAQPEVALALLIPGVNRIALVRGRAQLTIDEAARERFTVKDKTPLLAIRVEVEAMALHDSGALARADPCGRSTRKATSTRQSCSSSTSSSTRPAASAQPWRARASRSPVSPGFSRRGSIRTIGIISIDAASPSSRPRHLFRPHLDDADDGLSIAALPACSLTSPRRGSGTSGWASMTLSALS